MANNTTHETRTDSMMMAIDNDSSQPYPRLLGSKDVSMSRLAEPLRDITDDFRVREAPR